MSPVTILKRSHDQIFFVVFVQDAVEGALPPPAVRSMYHTLDTNLSLRENPIDSMVRRQVHFQHPFHLVLSSRCAVSLCDHNLSE